MTPRVRVEATLRTMDDVSYITPQTVVGIAPSSVDARTDEMRVAVNGHIIVRAFDPGLPVVTDFPDYYVTKSGEQYVTKAAEPYVTKVKG